MSSPSFGIKSIVFLAKPKILYALDDNSSHLAKILFLISSVKLTTSPSFKIYGQSSNNSSKAPLV